MINKKLTGLDLEEEISVTDILDAIIKNRNLIAIFTLISILLGVFYLLVTPKSIKGYTTMSIATFEGKPLLSQSEYKEILKQPSFYSQDALKKCNVDPVTHEYKSRIGLINRITFSPVPNSNLMTFKLSADKLNIYQCAESILSDINLYEDKNFSSLYNARLSQLEVFEKKLKDSIDKKLAYESAKKNEIDNFKDRIKLVEEFEDSNPLTKQSFNFTDEQFGARSLMISTLLSKGIEKRDLASKIIEIENSLSLGINPQKNEINDLLSQISDIKLKLNPAQSKKSIFTTPFAANDLSVYPIPALIIALSILLGLVLSFIVIALKSALKPAKRQ